jgi:ABC-type Na+ transport system ATPase subunit NatA
LLGETGTGKTQVIKKFTSILMLDKSKWEIGEMVLSATTTAI